MQEKKNPIVDNPWFWLLVIIISVAVIVNVKKMEEQPREISRPSVTYTSSRSASTTANICRQSGCTRKALEGYHYCRDHMCLYDCDNPRYLTKPVCREHCLQYSQYLEQRMKEHREGHKKSSSSGKKSKDPDDYDVEGFYEDFQDEYDDYDDAWDDFDDDDDYRDDY